MRAIIRCGVPDALLFFGLCGIAAAQVQIGSVTPTNGTGAAQTFTVTVTSWANSISVNLYIGNSWEGDDPPTPCLANYSVNSYGASFGVTGDGCNSGSWCIPG